MALRSQLCPLLKAPLRNMIAERVLGLPPEIRADKGIVFKDDGPQESVRPAALARS